MSYDSKCYELAAYFLMDASTFVRSEDHRKRLAQTIQDTIEQELQEWEEEAAEREAEP